MTRRAYHPRLRHLGKDERGQHRYEFIEAEHGELDFRIVSEHMTSFSMTEYAAFMYAAKWTESLGRNFSVESRIVGVTDWEPALASMPGAAA